MQSSTIVAPATPPGTGALGIIRLSGPDAVTIIEKIFTGKKLSAQPSHTIHFGRIVSPQSTAQRSEVIDEVVVSLYRAPHSYTGEDVVEISCHGSSYIITRILEVCVAGGGILAREGEFTQRAFLNGRMDLTQAEAVADLIASESRAAQQSAMHQLRGGFSNDLKRMREELITFSALIELELDFSQEDVEFADRAQLSNLIQLISTSTKELINSFRLGNAVKNGVSVAIIGAPNAGKSTLLNVLLNEERAIVSEIAGTTRDTIEEVINIDGILYRFIDTAGIRESTTDTIEQQGIARSRKKAEEADIVIHLVDGTNLPADVEGDAQMNINSNENKGLRNILVVNKWDSLTSSQQQLLSTTYPEALYISAKESIGIDALKARLRSLIITSQVQPGSTIITNTRHLSALQQIDSAVEDIRMAMDNNISGELLALDIRRALHYIGELTGEVQVDRDILGAIFGKFCIGK